MDFIADIKGSNILFIVLIALIAMLTVKHAPKSDSPILIYTVEQKTCSGKPQYRYKKCINLRVENGFTTFDVIDNSSDVIEVKIVGGIINIERKKDKINDK